MGNSISTEGIKRLIEAGAALTLDATKYSVNQLSIFSELSSKSGVHLTLVNTEKLSENELMTILRKSHKSISLDFSK